MRVKSMKQDYDPGFKEECLSHCALNQLNYWLYMRGEHAAITYSYKSNSPKWEHTVESYIDLCYTLINLLLERCYGDVLLERVHKYLLGAKPDEIGLRAFFEFMLLLISPIIAKNTVNEGLNLMRDKTL